MKSSIPYNKRFARIELMLGENACSVLKDAHVLVVGIGAVGSYAIEGLARSGIGKFTIVDCDKVMPSNINRQLIALESTIGRSKCEVAKERILDINPECIVEAVEEFVNSETVDKFLDKNPDIVIDAIDSLTPKVDLIEATRNKNLDIVCCLGAALRSDTQKVKTAVMNKVTGCPLGREVKSRLRKRGVPLDMLCVYSDEPMPNPLPIAPPDEPMHEEPLAQRGRKRNTMGSLPTITGIFGLTAANLAVKILLGKEF